MEKALAIQKEVMKILGTDEVYLVGGSVRDLVMGNTPKDYDFCTPMLPDDIEEAVQGSGRRAYSIGKKFGTIGFKVPVPARQIDLDSGDISFTDPKHIHWGYEYVEVTTFRSEVYTNKSRKPEVKFVPSLEEDLARRDFTMNAMVLRPDGTIYDPYGGKLDIHAKLIKTVGMPKDRIQEDPLRMLRAARFAARYGFMIDPNFIGKARHLVDRIYDVSVERWTIELDKLFTSSHYKDGIQALYDMRLLANILPELPIYECLYNHTLGEDADLAWKKILEPVSGNERVARYINTGICARLKFSNDRTDIILGKK